MCCFDEFEVAGGADHGSRVAGDCDDGQFAEDGVDGAALEPEFAQVGAGEECAWCCEELGGGGSSCALSRSLPFFASVAAATLAGQFRVSVARASHATSDVSVADKSLWVNRLHQLDLRRDEWDVDP